MTIKCWFILGATNTLSDEEWEGRSVGSDEEERVFVAFCQLVLFLFLVSYIMEQRRKPYGMENLYLQRVARLAVNDYTHRVYAHHFKHLPF